MCFAIRLKIRGFIPCQGHIFNRFLKISVRQAGRLAGGWMGGQAGGGSAGRMGISKSDINILRHLMEEP